jgi:hypothetical protein
MRFASLGSGSQGNGLVVEAGSTRVLLDCGFSLGDTASRLGRYGLAPDDLDAIVVTHEHDDHVGGVARLAAKYELPVYLTHGTLMALDGARAALHDVTVIDSHTITAIGDPNSSRIPCRTTHANRRSSSSGMGRCGWVLTDVGTPTAHIQSMLSGVDACAGMQSTPRCSRAARIHGSARRIVRLVIGQQRGGAPAGRTRLQSAPVWIAPISRTEQYR